MGILGEQKFILYLAYLIQKKTLPQVSQSESSNVIARKVSDEAIPIEVATLASVARNDKKEVQKMLMYAKEPEITLNWERYSPASKEQKSAGPKKGIIYLPGCMLTESGSTGDISQAFADEFGVPVFAIHTQPSTSLDESLLYEAEAIKKFVEESGLDEVIIVANSQSTKRALRLIESMQEKKHTGLKKNPYDSDKEELDSNPNTEQIVKGLVLLAPVGLGKNENLASKFFGDALRTLSIMEKEGLLGNGNWLRALHVGADIGYGLGYEFLRAPGQFLRRCEGVVGEMSEPFQGKVDVPVCIIRDPKDPVGVINNDDLSRIFTQTPFIVSLENTVGHGAPIIINSRNVARMAYNYFNSNFLLPEPIADFLSRRREN